jgi:hypothetical protein
MPASLTVEQAKAPTKQIIPSLFQVSMANHSVIVLSLSQPTQICFRMMSHQLLVVLDHGGVEPAGPEKSGVDSAASNNFRHS